MAKKLKDPTSSKGKGGRPRERKAPAKIESPVEREIDVPLEMGDVMRAFKEIGDTGRLLRALRADRRVLGQQIKDKQGHMDELLESAESMSGKRKVKVREVPDFEAKVVRTYRQDLPQDDPKALLDTRPMTGGEIQAGSVHTPAEAARTLRKIGEQAGENGDAGQGAFGFDGDDPPRASAAH